MNFKATTTQKIYGSVITTVCVFLGLMGGAYAYDQNQREKQHAAIISEMIAGNIELDLQRVELELKLLRTIRERRALTEDEADRKRYLIDLRKVLLTKQRAKS